MRSRTGGTVSIRTIGQIGAGATSSAMTASAASDEVERRPQRSEPSHRQVAVQVADEEDGLEEEQDGRPDRRRATEDRQHQPADERLAR